MMVSNVHGIDVIKENQKAPSDGYFFTEKDAQEVNRIIIELDIYIELEKKCNDKLTKAQEAYEKMYKLNIQSNNDVVFWRNTSFVMGGMTVVCIVSYFILGDKK